MRMQGLRRTMTPEQVLHNTMKGDRLERNLLQPCKNGGTFKVATEKQVAYMEKLGILDDVLDNCVKYGDRYIWRQSAVYFISEHLKKNA